jgi:acyl carrier protein
MRAFIAQLIHQPLSGMEPDSGLGATPGWDSFAQLNVMMELERRFGIDITDEAIRSYSLLANILKLEADRENVDG